MTPEVSVVAPVYNEIESLDAFVDELLGVMRPTGIPFEIVLVDDGSKDGSAEKIADLARRNPEVRGIHFKANRGQTAAFDAGFKNARGNVVVTIDADMQNDPNDIPKLLTALDGHDAAVGYRATRRDDAVRRLSSKIANGIRNRLSGDDIIDTGCSLKAFRASALAPIKLYTGMHRFLPTLVKIEGGTVVQVPVGHRPRLQGTSKYGVWNRVFRAFVDLLAVRWMKKRHLGYEIAKREP
ncbi:MAG TPA: glycosyltransferase family 2 protein [Candidatus Polarisedimenticolaceae bacterium]|nr:glycosyltransferase family 2 protein [Candidatus Polarisedimenticolaceae bacterium]